MSDILFSSIGGVSFVSTDLEVLSLYYSMLRYFILIILDYNTIESFTKSISAPPIPYTYSKLSNTIYYPFLSLLPPPPKDFLLYLGPPYPRVASSIRFVSYGR